MADVQHLWDSKPKCSTTDTPITTWGEEDTTSDDDNDIEGIVTEEMMAQAKVKCTTRIKQCAELEKIGQDIYSAIKAAKRMFDKHCQDTDYLDSRMLVSSAMRGMLEASKRETTSSTSSSKAATEAYRRAD